MSRKTVLAWLLLLLTTLLLPLLPVQGTAQEPLPGTVTSDSSLPSSIDWRNHGGDWTTPVRDQHDCDSSAAFAALGAVESRLEIAHDNPDENPDLSEQHLFFCGGGDCVDGWPVYSAMDFVRDTGVADESCAPYDDQDHTCSLCSDWQDRVTRTHCWYSVSGRNSVKYYLANYGPVETTMVVYQDFYTYTSGIYTHTWGGYEKIHAITLVGYDDGGGYWIGKNSWGTGWGEDGWFRVAYGDVVMDAAYVPVFDQVPPGKPTNVRPDGWSGPYTNDATPCVQWDPATDNADGCGIQGYYVAVDDWTPDGSGDDDWWAGDATDFTVPHVLADGAHILAVTAVDRGNNPNPTDTDVPGDAPFYTFTVDTVTPESQVLSLPSESVVNFVVAWSGSDTTSGVASFDVQVRDGSALWQDWKISTESTSAVFRGTKEHTYCFRSRARDHAGNLGAWASSPDGCTTVKDVFTFLPLILDNWTYVSVVPSPRRPNDPYYGLQWALEKAEAPAAWGYATGQGVLIAVLDTGIDLDHPDLVEKVLTDVDRDFVNDDDEADDDHGHGTHVSGIAAAATNNGTGVAGLGWEAMLLPLKVLRADGVGQEDDLAAAIRWAADNGADVINMSLGGPSACPAIVQEAADYAYGKGVVLVAAAGNHGGNVPNAEMFPANCKHVLGVAATDQGDAVANYSNYGSHVSVAAPGSSIYSTLVNDRYGSMSGTSMATPNVAGVAALLCARYPFYAPGEIASAILDNADGLGADAWDCHSGCGRINARRSLRYGKLGSSPLCLQTRMEDIRAESWAAGGRGATPGAATAAPFVPGELIVSFRRGTRVASVSRQYRAEAEFVPEIEAWRLRVPPGQEQGILAQLRADPAVVHAGLNHLVFAQ